MGPNLTQAQGRRSGTHERCWGNIFVAGSYGVFSKEDSLRANIQNLKSAI